MRNTFPSEIAEREVADRRLLAKNLRLLRYRAGISQEVLAERSSLAMSQVQRAESAKLNLTISTVSRLAFGLGVPIKTLFAVGEV